MDDIKIPIKLVPSVHSLKSDEDPPMETWSSLDLTLVETNKKKMLFDEGLYDPGSGEICAEYVTMSSSSVLRHAYYNYPGILDPGIKKALFNPETVIIYPIDGQALYLDICKEMKQCPVRLFYKGLVESRIINLRYYGVNPDGVRPMAKALEYNKTVEVLDLTDNFLHGDACFHLGEMLLSNNTLIELNLHGCRIGPSGAKRLFSGLPMNKALEVLDLSNNKLGDESMEYLASAILFGINVKNLNLSYNNITGKGVELLIEPFETHNKFTHLDLSWNTIFTPGGSAFLTKLSESTCLQVLNLSWNSLSNIRVSIALKQIVLCPRLRELNLSNNLLKEEAIKLITSPLIDAKELTTLNLSDNPLIPSDAISILEKVQTSNLENLFMNNVPVTVEFVALLEQTKQIISKRNLVVTYGDVISDFKAEGPDVRKLVLDRMNYVTQNTKKHKIDFALMALQLQKDKVDLLNTKQLYYTFRRAGVVLDEDLIEELALSFPGPSLSAKVKVLDVNKLVDYIKRIWPDRKLPPTPPPEPEPEPEPKPKKNEKKGKKIGVK